MLQAKIAENVINQGLEMGANFVDIFVEENQREVVSFNSSVVKNIESGIDFGVGVRLIFGTQALYGYTNSANEKDLIDLVQKLGSYYKRAPVVQHPTYNFEKPLNYKNIHACGLELNPQWSMQHKVQKIRALDEKIRTSYDKVDQINITSLLRRQKIEVFDSEGLYATELRPYARFMTALIAKDGDIQGTGHWFPGARGTWDYVETLNLEEISDIVIRQADTGLRAIPCPAGKMPVVIDNGFGGVIFHEACGHLLETTSVEKKSSVLWDKKGELVAHPAVSAVDDGTMDDEWGSLSIDDEGMPTQRTQLIKDGVITNFLSDRLGEMKTGHKRTGSARRQNYKFAPASRMRNTFIEPGKHKLDELLAAMGDGVYARSMGGGSVNPGTGEFNFAVQEGYLVKDGKIKEPVKGATLIGRGEDILKKISMVGDNFALATGMCGSVSGSIPTTVGQPAIKVDEILVGGAG